ncbi:MAG: hypothetical protein HC861_11445 [Rhodospirillaceae bacterium]|nr:hypothetical protein [Rhodospirillaceae bacterium]
MITVYVPCDASAVSLGADEVAHAIQAEADKANTAIKIIRNGSRGLFWLEPMVEVATPQGRIAYGPVSESDVAGLFAAGFLQGAEHALRLGKPEEIPYLKNQERLTFERCGVIDPLSIEDYIAHGGYRGLANALKTQPADIVTAVTESGLRGRGGAGFPTGIKWKTVLGCKADQKYIVCNADEGDSGTFADRMIMEGDPLVLIEGMTIAGIATGATYGYIYIRSEYPHAIAKVETAINACAHMIEPFVVEVRVGAGAYVCGEETSLLNSLEGKHSLPAQSSAVPGHARLRGPATAVNNVETLCNVPHIVLRGAVWYAGIGPPKSTGPRLFSVTQAGAPCNTTLTPTEAGTRLVSCAIGLYATIESKELGGARYGWRHDDREAPSSCSPKTQ